MATAFVSVPAGLPASPALLATLPDLLPLGVMHYTPVVDATGTLTDLSKLQLVYAGPAELVPLAPATGATGVQLTVEVAPALLVSFSPANLRSAIHNLLSNAVKSRDPDRPAQVRIRASSAGGRVGVAVQDNGLGLSAHQRQRLFGLFQRLHTHVEGTDVGLYITKRLVENGGTTSPSPPKPLPCGS